MIKKGLIKKIKVSALCMCAVFTLMSTSALAAESPNNRDFTFTLSNTSSKENQHYAGLGTKGYDGDQYAYVKPNGTQSNLAIRGASVNFRVRDNAHNYATEYVNCNAYKTYTMKYLSGKAVGGANYRLYANVETANAYPVVIGGTWCP